MNNEILIELGIEGLPYNLYDVATNSLFESVNKNLRESNISHSNLSINYSKNRIIIKFNFIDQDYNNDFLVNVIKNIINTTHIPIRGLKFSNNIIDYVIWIQAIKDDEVLNFTQNNIKDYSAIPFFKIESIDSYLKELTDNNIIFENDKRKDYFSQHANKIAKEHGGELHDINYLLEKVISEYNMPHPVAGSFNSELLNFPKELIVSILMDICNVFPIYTDRGQLTPYYIYCIEKYKKDNEKYLTDYNNDINKKIESILDSYKTTLNEDYETYIEKMKSTTLPDRVGNLYDKSQRLKELSTIIGDYLLVGDETEENLEKASEIAKFDLTTDIVHSHPQLKGVIGSLYAKQTDSNDIVVNAIRDHYKPKYFHDSLPSTTTGKVLSLADKLDEITNSFIYYKLNDNISEYQTSEIRRCASGIIKLILNNKWNLNISNVINDSLYLYIKYGNMVLDTDELKNEIYNFIIAKFREDVVRSYSDYCKIDELIDSHPNNLLETYESLMEENNVD